MLYVAVDFESLDLVTWSTFGVLGVVYPEGRTVFHLEIGNAESEDLADVSLEQKFWTQHSEARQYNKQLNLQCSRRQAEETIAREMDNLRKRHPDFVLVCDNPAFDVRLLDNILVAHHLPVISVRPGGVFRQPVCIWSYRLGAKARVQKYHRAEQILLGVQVGPKHTPIFDCAHTLCNFWNLRKARAWKR